MGGREQNILLRCAAQLRERLTAKLFVESRAPSPGRDALDKQDARPATS